MTEAGRVFARLAAVAAQGVYPLVQYQSDPIGYARERLGVEFLPHQAAFAFAFANMWDRITPEMAELAQLHNPGRRRIAVRSGQKTGKTKSIIVLALWFFECFPEARSMVTAAIGDQIRSVVWRELYLTLLKAPHRPPEEPSEDPSRGLQSADRAREVRGFTGRTIEAIAGISGNLCYFVDEASHLEQAKYEALDGNTAGEGDLGAPIVFTSQGTRNSGPFFDAFHGKSETWSTMCFDSEAIAKYQARAGIRVRGMATLAWCEAKREEYGPESPFYILRVKGGFVKNETGRIVTMHEIEGARARFLEPVDPDDAAAVLTIGFDPAGPGDGGDEHGYAAVRGKRCLKLHTKRGIAEDPSLAEVYAMLEEYRRPNETPRVSVDAEGKLGASFYGRLRAEAEHRRVHSPATAFTVVGVRTSSRHVVDPTKFVRVRDEVWWSLSAWIRTGAIPLDHKLEAELYAPVWLPTPDGKIFATSKKELRELLGRSTDRADCLALAVFRPVVWTAEDFGGTAGPGDPGDLQDEAAGYDQQEGNDIWWPG